MPELPEVETVIRTLEKQIKDCKVLKCEILYSNIVESEKFAERIENQSFRCFKRRGKFLIFEMDDVTLIVHLRMEGKFFVEPVGSTIEKHTHVIFTLNDNRELRYNDVRKFGRMWLYKKDDDYKCLNNLGLEPWDESLTSSYLLDKYKNQRNPIKTVLLDQSIIAGIGNIYANEICFLSKINPCTKANEISESQAELIIENTKNVLSQAIKAGGTTIRSYTSSLGVTGLFQQNLYVHSQDKCKVCDSKIEKIFLNGRGTYFCPVCQKSKTKTIAVTGSIGSGKSTFCNELKKEFLVISCDDISHNLLEKSKEIKKEFSDCVVNNKIDRKLLSSIVFKDVDKLNKLNSILHPLILNEVLNELKTTNDDYAIIEVPLLFEAGWDKYFDYSLLVKTDEDKLIERLVRDRKMTISEVKERLNAQMSIKDKSERADIIIENDKDLDNLYLEVRNFITKLKENRL